MILISNQIFYLILFTILYTIDIKSTIHLNAIAIFAITIYNSLIKPFSAYFVIILLINILLFGFAAPIHLIIL